MAIANRVPAAGKPAARVGVAAKPVQASASKANGVTTLHAAEARITVTQTVLENGTVKGEPITADQVEIKTFVTNPANVGANVQYTRNLGNFESVKIGVMVNVPCYVEEVDNVFAQVVDKAKTKLEEAIAELQIAPSEAVADDITPSEPAAETIGTEAEAEGTIDLEYLKAADDATLREVATGNELGINPDDYAEEDDLRQVLIQAILGEDVLQAYLSEKEAAGEGAEAETEAETEDGGYTEEQLTEATLDELKEVFAEWKLGDYPKGPAGIAKKAAIKKILAAQAGQ